MRIVLLFTLISTLTYSSYSQEDIFRPREIVSPEINNDNSVTFRLKGPDASKVTISGSWMPTEQFQPGVEEMQEGEDGVWSYTTSQLPANLYRYSFFVDGVRTTDPANAHAIRDVATLSSIFLVEGDPADLYKPQDVPHGTLAYRWYVSEKLNKSRRLSIYTPAGYESSEIRYPVLYLLHGIGGDEEAWIGTGRVVQILDNLIAYNKAKPMIVVLPNGNVAQKAAPGMADEGYVIPTFNLPNTMDGVFEESFGEIMNFVEANYRTIEKKQSRAIAGLSMGGYHTAFISQNYPNTFDHIGLFSPAMNVSPTAHPEAPAYQDLGKKLLIQRDNGYKTYYIAVGKEDFPVLYEGIQMFRKKLDEINMPYEYTETEGGHTWDNWRSYLVDFSQKIFKN